MAGTGGGEQGERRDTMEDYYAVVRNGYDLLAASYDQDIGSNPIGLRMRDVFRRALLALFHPGDRVFEIGCGTGLEAIWLANRGIEVVATDISNNMLLEVRAKAKVAGLSHRVHCRQLAAHEVGLLSSEFGGIPFDGGFCHAGGLNMEPNISQVPGQVRSLLRADGHFVLSVINKTSLFEVLFYSFVLRPRKAFRRLDNVVPIPISRKKPLNRYVIGARFFSPSDIVRLFHEGFVAESIEGLEIFLPPSNLADHFSTFRPFFGPLEFLESRLSKKWPLNTWGHHTILTLRRK